MIENIKRILNEHQTLIVVVISVLIICFIYWWFCCKDRPLVDKVKGGEVGESKILIWNGTIFYIHETLGFNIIGKLLCWMLTSNGESLVYKNIIFQQFVLFNNKFFNERNCYLPDVISSPVNCLLPELKGSTLRTLFPITQEEEKNKVKKKGRLKENESKYEYPDYVKRIRDKLFKEKGDKIIELKDANFDFQSIIETLSDPSFGEIITWYNKLTQFLKKYGGDFVIESNYIGQPSYNSTTSRATNDIDISFTNINDVKDILVKIKAVAIDKTILSLKEEGREDVALMMEKVLSDLSIEEEKEHELTVLDVLECLKIDGKRKEIIVICETLKELKNEQLEPGGSDSVPVVSLEENDIEADDEENDGISVKSLLDYLPFALRNSMPTLEEVVDRLRKNGKKNMAALLIEVVETRTSFIKKNNQILKDCNLKISLKSAEYRVNKIENFISELELKNENVIIVGLIKRKIEEEMLKIRNDTGFRTFYCYSETKNKMFDEKSNGNTYGLCNSKIRNWYSDELVKEIFNKSYFNSKPGEISATWGSKVGDIADVYPAFKVILMLYFLVYLCPVYIGDKQMGGKIEDYYKMVASYLVFVQLFNSFCACRMFKDWNTKIKNQVVYGFENINVQEFNLMNLEYTRLEELELKEVLNQVDRTMGFATFYEKIGFYTNSWKIPGVLDEAGKYHNSDHETPKWGLGNLKIKVDEGYYKYWTKGILTDVKFSFDNIDEIIYNDYERKAHMLILAKESEYFRNKAFSEPVNEVRIVHVLVKSSLFIKSLRFMYGCDITVNGYDELFQMFNLARAYKIGKLWGELIKIFHTLFCYTSSDPISFFGFFLILGQKLLDWKVNEITDSESRVAVEKFRQDFMDLANKKIREVSGDENVDFSEKVSEILNTLKERKFKIMNKEEEEEKEAEKAEEAEEMKSDNWDSEDQEQTSILVRDEMAKRPDVSFPDDAISRDSILKSTTNPQLFGLPIPLSAPPPNAQIPIPQFVTPNPQQNALIQQQTALIQQQNALIQQQTALFQQLQNAQQQQDVQQQTALFQQLQNTQQQQTALIQQLQNAQQQLQNGQNQP